MSQTPDPYPVPSNESTAIAEFRAGSITAFEWLAIRYMDRAIGVAQRIVRSPADAEDVVQDALVRAWQKRDSFVGAPGFGAWLLRIVRNRALDILRHRRTVSSYHDLGIEHPQAAGPEDHLATIELEAAILALPMMQCAVATMVLLYGYSADEIAEVTGLQPATVRSHLSLARKSLRKTIAGSTHAAPRTLPGQGDPS